MAEDGHFKMGAYRDWLTFRASPKKLQFLALLQRFNYSAPRVFDLTPTYFQLILTLLSSYTSQTAACKPKEYAWVPDMFDMYQSQSRLCACQPVGLRQYSWLPADFLRIAVAGSLIKRQRRILFFCTFDRRMLT